MREAHANGQPVLHAGSKGQINVSDPGKPLLEKSSQYSALFRRNSAGPPVGDQSVFDRRVIAPDGDIRSSDLKTETERLEDAPSDLKLKRVISEKGKMSWAAPRCDPGCNRRMQAARG